MTEKDEDNERDRGGDMKYVNSTIVRKSEPNIGNKILILPPTTCENI